MRVYLIRHGQTKGNLEKRYVGSTDESLTREGAKGLLEKRGRYSPVEMVFASPMKRCLETAEILFPGIPCRKIKGLRNVTSGNLNMKIISL